ncbi:LytR/AlgR family response regulator transcription factor [Marinoscillum furvescens]|uniref:Response regulator receiver domain-containing protein n=1 Tax=Marinoscillum furvescens DSM 4134 TaxID=1122208 RepID=A0A3D9LGM3_MARFU|nr:response regulator [Marinoscillum furvescens]REE05798.1 response regulator receiver domain-containing protein [Marinoscillum furvescens DSM 4134]
MKLRAIAIDDDPTATLIIKRLSERIPELELVSTYNDPIRGAAGIILDQPDVIFLDVEMPELSGIDIMKALVKPKKIIVISGNETTRQAVMDLNAVSFIAKPPTVGALQEAMEQIKAS